MKVRVAEGIALGTTLGAGLAAVANVADWLARYGIGDLARTQLLHVKILDSPFALGFPLIAALVSWWRVVGLVLIAMIVLVPWRRTRPIPRSIVAGVAAIFAAWSALYVGVAVYLVLPSAAFVLPLAAWLLAIRLGLRATRPVTPAAIVAVGFVIAVVAAQLPIIAIMSPIPVPSPLYGFSPVAMLALALAWIVSRYARARTRRFPLVQFWGLCTLALAALFIVGYEIYLLRARPASGAAVPVLEEWAYDVYVQGEPPSLLWTNRQQLQVVENVGSDTQQRYAIDDRIETPERIWPSATGDFYLQTDGPIGWWKPVPNGERVPNHPFAWLSQPEWVYGSVGPGSGTCLEDPATGRLLILSAFQSRYVVMDRATWTVLAEGTISKSPWGWWWFATLDPATRTAVISSAIGDGGLYDFDMDSLHMRQRGSDFYLYETALEPSGELLWGVRPITGEVLGVDTRTQAIRYRIPVQPGARDLQLNPQTGDLYTCSFLFGDIFRIDTRAQRAEKLGWCGRLCRNLYLDAQRQTLWVATTDRICRIDVRRDAARVSSAPNQARGQ